MKNRLFLLLLTLVVSLQAKPESITIPHQDWKLTIDAPPMTVLQENQDGNGPVFAGLNENFNLSIFVEVPHGKAGSSKDCYRYYWEKSLENPLIKRDSVTVSLLKSFYRVEYLIEDPDTKRSFKQKNVNYFFAQNDRWVDVHISVTNPTSSDESVFAAFDKGLKIDQTNTSPSPAVNASSAAPGITILPLSNTDALSLALSPNWKMEPFVVPTGRFPFVTFPFRPLNGTNASMLVTVYAKYQEQGKINDPLMRKLIIGDCTPWIANSVDKKMAEIHSILLEHGRGIYASFADANLIGKPSIKGDYKISTCFILNLENQYLIKITVLCDDLASREYREAVTMIKSLAEEK